MKVRKLNCISLFSGCGGLDLGLHAAGFDVLLATDAEQLCADSYLKNFPDTKFITKRIGELTYKDLKKSLGKKLDNIDLIAGGPPCPPFSKSRFYRKEKPRALEDPTGWETINGYLQVLEWVRPRAFIMENVKGLAYTVHKEALDTIINSAEKLGYSVLVKVLNAADYGVPQIRERCFVVGTLDGEIESDIFPKPTHSKTAEGKLKPWVPTRHVLNDLDTEENASNVGHFAGGRHFETLCKVPPGDNYLYFTVERGHPKPLFKWRSRYWSFLLKLSPDLPSWTIQARRSNNMGPFHWRNRILRIEEIKRLQTFPDSHWLAGNIEQQWRQIGNAVPPLLAEAVAKKMYAYLTQKTFSKAA